MTANSGSQRSTQRSRKVPRLRPASASRPHGDAEEDEAMEKRRALGAALAAQVERKLAIERLGLEPQALLLARQILEQGRERHVRRDAADLGPEEQALRDRPPQQGFAEAEAGDRRLAQLLEAGRRAVRARRRARRPVAPPRSAKRWRRDARPRAKGRRCARASAWRSRRAASPIDARTSPAS